MKKITRSILFLLICAMLAASLASCTGNDTGIIGKKPKDFDKIYQADVTMPFDTGYLSAKDVELTNIINAEYGFALYRDASTNEYCIYNLETDQTVLRIDSARIQKETDVTLCDGFIRAIEKATDTEQTVTNVYGANGTLLATAEGEIAVSANENGFSFQEKFYHVKDGELKRIYTIPPFTNINTYYTFTDQYVIYVRNRTAIYYNDNFEVVALYEVPGHCENYRIELLDNESLFVQYSLLCDSNSKKYDYMNNQKYTLHSLIFDPSKNREKELELDVYALSIDNRKTESTFADIDFADLFTEEVENILSYYAIVDGVIDQSTVHYVLIDNDGKIGASLDQYVENQKSLILPLNNGYYYVMTTEGYAILDGKGEELRRTSGLGRATEYGYISNNKIYNHQFELVVDLSNAIYTNINTSGDVAAFYSKKVENQTRYFRYDKNGEAEIVLPNDKIFADYNAVTIQKNYYTVKYYNKTDDYQYSWLAQYDFYTFHGELLFSIKESEITVVTESENAMLVSFIDPTTSKTIYKRLTK